MDTDDLDTEELARALEQRLEQNVSWNEDTPEFTGTDLDNMEVALLMLLREWIARGEF